jgi:hypothetical protein
MELTVRLHLLSNESLIYLMKQAAQLDLEAEFVTLILNEIIKRELHHELL